MPERSAPLVRYQIYPIGDLGSGIFAVLPAILLMFYMTNVLGVPAALATFAAFVPKIVDLVAGPVVGAISDRSRSRFGRRRPFLLAGPLLACPIFALVWAAPLKDPTLAAYFVMGAFSLATALFAMFVVPFMALNAELPRDYHERTTLNAWRTGYVFVGLILAGADAPLIAQLSGGGRHGYAVMGLTMATIILVVTLITFFTAREPPTADGASAPGTAEVVRALAQNRPFLLLFLSYFSYITSAGASGAALAYFVTYVLGRDPAFLSLLFFVSYAASIAAIPAWSWLSRKIGKLHALQAALGLLVLTDLIYLSVTASTPLPLLIVLTVLAGCTGSAVQVLIFSMLGDSILHGNKQRSLIDAAAALNGLFICGEKLGFALGALIGGLIFAAAGLVATTHGAVEQTPQVIGAIRGVRTVVPALFNSLALLTICFYLPFERGLLATHGLSPVPQAAQD